jgi:hypothetical protein
MPFVLKNPGTRTRDFTPYRRPYGTQRLVAGQEWLIEDCDSKKLSYYKQIAQAHNLTIIYVPESSVDTASSPEATVTDDVPSAPVEETTEVDENPVVQTVADNSAPHIPTSSTVDKVSSATPVKNVSPERRKPGRPARAQR